MEQSTKKPDFTGTWELDLIRSSYKIPSQLPPLKSSTFFIDHKEPHWVLDRTHVWEDENIKDVLKIEQDIDGKYVIHDWTNANATIKARMYWENEAIIFDSEIIFPNEIASNIARYKLEDNGETFIADENYQSESHSHVNHWVFNKK